MANKLLIIGVGSAGVIAADKMDVPNSKKLFIDSSYQVMREVKSEGDQIVIECEARSQCPSLYCSCFEKPEFSRNIVTDYEDEIRQSIINAFVDDDFNIRD